MGLSIRTGRRRRRLFYSRLDEDCDRLLRRLFCLRCLLRLHGRPLLLPLLALAPRAFLSLASSLVRLRHFGTWRVGTRNCRLLGLVLQGQQTPLDDVLEITVLTRWRPINRSHGRVAVCHLVFENDVVCPHFLDFVCLLGLRIRACRLVTAESTTTIFAMNRSGIKILRLLFRLRRMPINLLSMFLFEASLLLFWFLDLHFNFFAKLRIFLV